jgi:hypothetical protein
MGLRPANRHENRPEFLQHPIKWTGLVKVEAAMGKPRPVFCLIRSVHLNERVRVTNAGCGVGENARRRLLL